MPSQEIISGVPVTTFSHQVLRRRKQQRCLMGNPGSYDKGNARLGVDYQFLYEMRSIECIKLVIYDYECHYLMYPTRQLQFLVTFTSFD